MGESGLKNVLILLMKIERNIISDAIICMIGPNISIEGLRDIENYHLFLMKSFGLW